VALIAVVAALGAPGSAVAAQELAPITYTAIDGHSETLVPWQGQHVSVLVEQGPTRDPTVMNKMVSALDAAFSYYAATTARVPAVGHSLNGRDEIAEVSSTCGAGCTYVGATGTEILTSYFESMYGDIASSGLYNQNPFYELGRSFWFWGPQLQFHSPDLDPVVTGFAVLMRFKSMAATGVMGSPFNGTPFPTFAAQVGALAGEYEANPSLTFTQTLAQDKSPGMYGGTDFWASLMMQLAARHGGQAFLNRFFQHVGTLPAATSTAGAVTNWLAAANYAACTDLSSVFYTRWGFPHPDGTVTTRPPADAVPEPTGSCPSVAQVKALLQGAPSGAAARIGLLLQRRVYRVSFTAPSAGRLAISWHASRTLVAKGTISFGQADEATVAIKLVPSGERLLRRVQHVHLTGESTFTPFGESTVTVLRKFALHR
jgi:hypothetical protein